MLYQSGSALPTIISTPNWKNVDLAPAPAQLPSKIRGRGIRRVSSALPNPFKFRVAPVFLVCKNMFYCFNVFAGLYRQLGVC